jgi:hypothetical protein
MYVSLPHLLHVCDASLTIRQQGYVTVIMVTPALGFIKFSLFLQYYHLFKIVRGVGISVYIGAVLSGTFYTAVSITAIVLTSPWPGESLLDGLLSWHYVKFTDFSIPTGVIGMLVDCILLVVPIPAIWQLQLSLRKKICVLLMFMTGAV